MNSGVISKVLIANRGETAARVIRAVRDTGIASVTVYADSDADFLFVTLADEASALGGATPVDTHLSVEELLDVARRSGADAVHPGYDFLAENAGFVCAVMDAGLKWIGPLPEAIESLGDKVKARRIAQKMSAPQVPGTPDPIADAAEVVRFAEWHDLPVAIKAAFGGGGRGLKVVRALEKIPELFDSATREAITAFGRGECFVEHYLDKPRHVETQYLADEHGNVVVISTRDCSLQRRHQKLVEEAPAPFLSPEQEELLRSSPKTTLKEAGYVGTGICEFLVGLDGTISFLEVNIRLQVKHPVSGEVTELDLVREMFRIAEGEELGYDDPKIHGHSIKFRINAEDAGRGFMPAPGTLVKRRAPTGPGIHVDEGYHVGMTVPGASDSLVAELIVTGANRPQVLARARRALGELQVEGTPTVVPFHQILLEEPDLVAADGSFGVHTRWIETEFTSEIPAHMGMLGDPEDLGEPEVIVVEVNGRRMGVELPAGFGARPEARGKTPRHLTHRDRGGARVSAPDGNGLICPIQGTVVKLFAQEGEVVEEGQAVTVIGAMKMEQPLHAHQLGQMVRIAIAPERPVDAGDVICEIIDLK